MHLPFALTLLLPPLLAPLTTAVICSTPPPPPSLLPSPLACNALIADILAISRLEDDERVVWSTSPPDGAGNRKLPYMFSHPSADNDCEIMVEPIKDDGGEGEGAVGDTFAVRDVARKAKDIVKGCLEVEGREKSIGIEVVGRARAIAVVVLKKIPVPVLEAGRGRNSFEGQAMGQQLRLNESGIGDELMQRLVSES